MSKEKQELNRRLRIFSVLQFAVALILFCWLAPIQLTLAKEIPITLQSLLVVLAGLFLGARSGFVLVSIYLILGALGLPIFANGSSGIEKFYGATAGFLFSFPIAAWCAGYCGARFKNIYGVLLAFCLGHAVILSLGFAWLGFALGFDGIFNKMVLLLPGLIVKVVIGSLLVGSVRRGIQHRKNKIFLSGVSC